MPHPGPRSLAAALILLRCAAFCQEPVVPGTLLEAENLSWQFTPAESFSALAGPGAFDAVDALAITPAENQAGLLQTTVTGPALVTWYWRRTWTGPVDPGMKLLFLYDDIRVADHDDEQVWEKMVIQIPPGAHTLQWRVPAGTPGLASPGAAVDLVTVYPGAVLPEAFALNDPNGLWLRTELGTQWQVSLTNNHDGHSAAEARPLKRNQGTSLRRLVTGPARIAWWWQLQGDDDNELKAKLRSVTTDDSTLVAEWDLDTASAWRKVTAVVPDGPHVINWRYEYDDPSNTDASLTAAGQVDEFSSSPIGLHEALGLPNQVWTFGGPWGVAFNSSDTLTPGSAAPASLPPGGSAWIQTSFTGPALLRWNQSRGANAGMVGTLSVDGVPVIGPGPLSPNWSSRHAVLPAGLHTVRWTFANEGDVDGGALAVFFDRPETLPLMAENFREALGVSVPVFFDTGSIAPMVVSNAPSGPEGATALRLSGTNTPLLALGEASPLPGPRLVSYHHRRVAGNFESLIETVAGGGGYSLSSTPEWKKRALFVTSPLLLGWNASQTLVTAFEMDGFSFDAPAADVAAFLLRTGVSWNVPEGAAVARIVDESVPVPRGEALFMLPSSFPLSTEVTGSGVLTVEMTDRFAAPGSPLPSTTLQGTANGTVMARFEESLPDRKVVRFAVPEGMQTLALSGSGVCLLRLAWLASPGGLVSVIAHEGLEGQGMTFTVSDPAALLVRTLPDSSRRVLTLQPGFPSPELRSAVTGPGVLTFDWRVSQNNGTPAVFQMGTPAQTVALSTDALWSRVRVAIPPGDHLVNWKCVSGGPGNGMDLDQFQWEPRVLAEQPDPGMMVSRTGGPLWRERRGEEGGAIITPWDHRAETLVPLAFGVDGPGMFSCEARLLLSHQLPHFAYQHGGAMIEIRLDGEPVLRAMACQEWLPVCVPLEAGARQITAALVLENGYDGVGAHAIPATLEIRRTAVLPLRSPPQVAQPGITWEAVPVDKVAVAEVSNGRGTNIRWHLQGAFQGAEGQTVLPAVTATIQGPGTLEWESTYEGYILTLSSNGAEVPGLQNQFGPHSPRTPSHQLVLPAGIHKVTWRRFAFFPMAAFGRDPIALGLDVRWLASANPALAAAVSLPPLQPLYFLSDGGWEPMPFDPATPWQRVRTRLGGPASVRVTVPPNSGNRTISFIRGDSDVASGPDSMLLFNNVETAWLDFFGATGERGPQLAPFTRSMVGRIPSSSAVDPALGGESFAQWTARLQVPADPAADPDLDGLSSLMESVLGTDPALAEGGAWQVLPGTPPVARFLWPLAAPADVVRSIETSPDLVNWTTVVPVVRDGIAEVMLPGPAKYARLRAVK